MKKLKQLGLIILGLIFGISFTNAAEYAYTKLDINADVLVDGTMNITETFTANFYVKKHGIIRNIPLNYSVNGNRFHIKINNVKVDGKKYTKTKEDGKLIIKIGNKNKYEQGKVVYPIHYTTYGLIKNFSGMGYSELYWNIVGYEFDTNIQKVYATINLPKEYTGFNSSDFQITTDGKTKTVEEFQGTIDWSQGNKIIITYDKNLPAKHGITLAIKFPNNYFEFNHKKQAKLIDYSKAGTLKTHLTNLKNYLSGGLLMFGVPLLFILAIILAIKGGQQNRIGKFNEKKYALKGELAEKYKTVIQYTPPKGLNSAEVGLLLHRRADLKDLFSLIYKRAAEGLIKISVDIPDNKNGKKNIKSIKIKKIKDIPESVPDFEKKFFNSFVSTNEKEILNYHNTHYLDLNRLDRHGVEMGWFKKNYKKLTAKAGIIALVIIIITVIMPVLIVPELAILLLYGIFSKPQIETEKGAELIAHILGYGRFLKACDEQQLKTFLKQDPLYFDKTLPFAVVFGLETEFLKKILPIMEEDDIEPKRYTGNIDNHILPSIVKDISKISPYSESHGGGSSYSSSGGFSSGSSFGGGGGGFSSGGGGGGGGGSSW